MFSIGGCYIDNSNILEMMEILVGVVCVLLMVLPVTYLWITGIDYMMKNHPDYKGEDFLDEE